MARPTGRSASSTLPSTSTSAAAATSRIGAAGAARASSRQQPLSPAAPSLLAPSLFARSALVAPAATALAPGISVDPVVAAGEIAGPQRGATPAAAHVGRDFEQKRVGGGKGR